MYEIEFEVASGTETRKPLISSNSRSSFLTTVHSDIRRS